LNQGVPIDKDHVLRCGGLESCLGQDLPQKRGVPTLFRGWNLYSSVHLLLEQRSELGRLGKRLAR
jgi:hypothetical protein